MTNPTSEFPMPASGQYDEEHLIVQDSPEGIWDDAGGRALLDSLEIHGVRSFGCAAVREICLPASCHRIEREAFAACPMLERLEIHRKNVENSYAGVVFLCCRVCADRITRSCLHHFHRGMG